jgi:hypothetical protein
MGIYIRHLCPIESSQLERLLGGRSYKSKFRLTAHSGPSKPGGPGALPLWDHDRETMEGEPHRVADHLDPV